MKRYEPDKYYCSSAGEDVTPAMRESATGRFYSRADLIAAGCLLSVPDGEACERRHCGSDTFLHDGNVYFDAGDKYRPKRLSDGAPIMVEWHTIVQPVRLVPLAEAEI